MKTEVIDIWRTKTTPGVVLLVDESGGIDLTGVFEEYWTKVAAQTSGVGGDVGKSAFDRRYKIPLIITTEPLVRRKAGWAVPSEFVIDIFHPDECIKRSEQLALAYPKGLTLDQLRSYGIGRLRRYLGLDADNHGHGTFNLVELRITLLETIEAESKESMESRKHEDQRIERAKQHRAKLAPWEDKANSFGAECAEFLRTWFEREFGVLNEEMQKLADSIKSYCEALLTGAQPSKERFQLNSAILRIEHILPRAVGLNLHSIQVSENGRCTVLILDDDENAAHRLRSDVPIECYYAGERKLRLGDLLDPTLVKLRPGLPTAMATAASMRKAFETSIGRKASSETFSEWLRRFDLVALDLSFGREYERESAGLQLIPLLQKFLPDIPLIVHSIHSEMSFIEQSFNRGAHWYLNKTESWKLPANYIQIVQNPLWQREWQAAKDEVNLVFLGQSDDSALEDAHKFLIWKAVREMPGSKIHATRLRGGIGGALTLSVRKGRGDRFDVVAPVVVKIARRFEMILERERYRRFILPYLSNRAGRIDTPLATASDGLGSIAYTYAGLSQGRTSGQHQLQILSLNKLFENNFLAEGQLLPFKEYSSAFDSLLYDTLPRIHAVQIDRASSGNDSVEAEDPDFPNSVFGEFEDPTDAMTTRMPPEVSFELESLLSDDYSSANQEFEVLSDLKPGDKIRVLILDVEARKDSRGDGRLKTVARLKKGGRFHRIDLVGNLAAFYARHRYFRPGQSFVATVSKSVKNEESKEAKHWKDLWADGRHGKQWTDSSDSCRPEYISERVIALREWLVKYCQENLRAVPLAIVHGDLNLGNIMVEQELGGPPKPYRPDFWLIDFAWTRRDRIVWDFVELETDFFTRLLKRDFFAKFSPSHPDRKVFWDEALDYFEKFFNAPHVYPASARSDKRLKLIYDCMNAVRTAGLKAGIDEKAYKAARAFQLLLVHKIICGGLKKNKTDGESRFIADLTLCLAFRTAHNLGFSDVVRVSAAVLARIEVNGAFLAEKNKKQGVISPLGGGFEVSANRKEELLTLGANFERQGKDFRLWVPDSQLPRLISCWAAIPDRELETDLKREIEEETNNLVRLDELKKVEFVRGKTYAFVEGGMRREVKGELTQYLHTFINLKIADEQDIQVVLAAEIACPNLCWLTVGEISAGRSSDGLELSTSAKRLLQCLSGIRVSASALVCLLVNERYLVEINKHRGDILTPLGGATAFEPSALPFLKSIEATFDEVTKRELRFSMPEKNLDRFREWLESDKDRELDPRRELHEELLDEHKVQIAPEDLARAALRRRKLRSWQETSTRTCALTAYYHEIYDASLPADAIEAIRAHIERGSSRLQLVTEDEIRARIASNGMPIATTVATLIP